MLSAHLRTPSPETFGCLPQVRGSIMPSVPLAPLTWLKVGGGADYVFTPMGLEDLATFLKHKPLGLPYTILGEGSNLLIRDGGIRGVVIRLTDPWFSMISREGDDLNVGAALLDKRVAMKACRLGLAGLEFLYTIPGTIGGALRMNAGAYGTEIAERLVHALVLDHKGKFRVLLPQDLGYRYRSCALPEGWIFVGARLRCTPDDSENIQNRMMDMHEQRRQSQPSGRTAGSTFTNPYPHKAWELIQRAGCQDLVIGGARLSPKHANFIVLDSSACAADVEVLGEKVRQRVFYQTGIMLQWEVIRMGDPA